MKNLLKYVIFAAAAVLATSSNAGTKGSEAAGLITSNPKTKNPVEGPFKISMTGWDSSTETTFKTDVSVSSDMTWEDVYEALGESFSAESAALNALMALCKAAYAAGLAEYNKLRIETLTDSVTKAFQSLDTIDLRDDVNEITKRLEKKDTTDDTTIYGGKGIFNVAGAQVDGKTISSNSEDKIQIYGFPGADALSVGLFPVIGNNSGEVGRIMWFDPWNYLDGDTIKIDRDDAYSHMPSKKPGKHGIHIAGWYDHESQSSENNCTESIATQLSRLPNEQETHYVLTKLKSDGHLHYTPLGRLASCSTDETTITTNGVTKGVLQIKNGSQEKQVIASATGGDSAAPAWRTLQEVTVIVGISKTTVDGVPKLSLTKKKIFVPYVEDITPNDVIDVADTVSVNAVLGTEYDDMTHQFYDQIGAVRVFGSTQPSSARRATPTFTAVEHATE